MSRTDKKGQTRQRILDAAGRGFRRSGYGGAGVDGLAREAGVTSGAFYVHFPSKAAAFRETVSGALADLEGTVRAYQARRQATWWEDFVRFYLGPKRRCDLAESCGLQSLTPEVARADSDSRAAYAAALLAIAGSIAAGPPSPGAPRDVASAYAALSTLVGAVSLARAVPDAALADQIARGAAQALLPGGSGRGRPARARS